MLLLVGLGNPGPRYAGNRHNVGFMAVDAIVRRRVFSPWRARFNGEVAEGHLGGERTLILKPMTFMNEFEQGRGRGGALPTRSRSTASSSSTTSSTSRPASVRMKKGGGAGGHNGLRDIDAHVGNDYRRVRIGIGHPGHKDLVLHWVLRDFEPDERDRQGRLAAQGAGRAGRGVGAAGRGRPPRPTNAI